MSYGQAPPPGGQPAGEQPYGQQPPPGAAPPPPSAPPPSGPPAYGGGSYDQQPPSHGGGSPYSGGAPGAYGGASAPWGPPPGGAVRPGTVTAGGVLCFIGGGFMVVIGLILAAVGGSGALDGQDLPGLAPGAATGILVGLGIGVLVFGAIVLLFGIAAFRGKQWGAIGAAVLAGLAVVSGIAGIAGGDGSGLIGTAWGVLAAVLLLLPRSREYYRNS